VPCGATSTRVGSDGSTRSRTSIDGPTEIAPASDDRFICRLKDSAMYVLGSTPLSPEPGVEPVSDGGPSVLKSHWWRRGLAPDCASR
jgi:hypothetical protein